jgi:uncharacterized protein
MTPFRFGSAKRQMFGILQSPDSQMNRGEAVMMCNPFGQEAIRSHRLFKLLADRLIRNGLHVMRFDYFGTGDSDGEDIDVDVDGLVDDVSTAHNELLSRINVSAVSWFGLRLGASIATLASAGTSTMLKRLVLLEPIFDGQQYVRELDEAHTIALKRSYGLRWILDQALHTQLANEIGCEALGFALPSEVQERLSHFAPALFAGAKASAISLFNTADADNQKDAIAKVQSLWLERGLLTSAIDIPESIVWTANEMMNASVVPVVVLNAISQAFGEQR